MVFILLYSALLLPWQLLVQNNYYVSILLHKAGNNCTELGKIANNTFWPNNMKKILE